MAKAPRFRTSVRAILGLVCFCGLILGALSLYADSYRREWLAEQRALAEVRHSLGDMGWASIKVGPGWLQALAGPSRARHFDRITTFYISMPHDGATALLEPRNERIVARHRAGLKHLERPGWSWMSMPALAEIEAGPP